MIDGLVLREIGSNIQQQFHKKKYTAELTDSSEALEQRTDDVVVVPEIFYIKQESAIKNNTKNKNYF